MALNATITIDLLNLELVEKMITLLRLVDEWLDAPESLEREHAIAHAMAEFKRELAKEPISQPHPPVGSPFAPDVFG